MPATARLIDHVEAPFDGAMNMAIDQVLLESASEEGVPILRLYGWKEPTLSLGYFQPIDSRQSHHASRDITLVRRSTGGGAIVHHHDLTYSLCLPASASERGANREIYHLMHRAIIASLNSLGISATRYSDIAAQKNDEKSFLCFERRTADDLIVSGYKVTGSAQRRIRGALLQHGSLLLATSPHAPSLPGASCITGKSISTNRVKANLIDRFASLLDFELSQSGLEKKELLDSEEVRKQRFANPKWTNKR